MFQELKGRFIKELVLVVLILDKKNKDESKCIRLCNRRNIIDRVQRWKVETYGLPLKISKWDREEYEIYDKEMLVIIRELEKWRHLLEDAKFKFKVWTDYKNLEYFIKAQNLNREQAYWVLYLSRFDFTLKYVSETKIGRADRLSKRPDWKART